MIRIWKNPELVRHLRAELRTTRALTIAAVVLVIALLIWLGCWGSRASEMEALRRASAQFGRPSAERLAEMERQSPMEVWFDFYRIFMYAQLGILTFWSLFSCAQSISGERERKTWDFQRATRLTAWELLSGKLLGEPVVAYFIVLCCLPVALSAGLLGRAGVANIAEAYLLIISAALFIGLAGLWLSSLFESRSRGVGLIGTFGLYLLFAFVSQAGESNFPGMAALSPLAGFVPLFKGGYLRRPTIFGSPVPWAVMSLLLYVTFGAWLVLMLLRTLTKDYEQMRPLSRWQTVGCAAFLNFTIYALYFPRTLTAWDPFTKFIVAINGAILFAMGLAMLRSHERLKVWWRTRGETRWPAFAEDGPQWPWLALSAAVGYGLLLWGLFAWKNALGLEPAAFRMGLLEFAVVLIFITRDITFIQWCRLTRMRAPVLKGVLFAGLYYVAAIVLSTVVLVYSEARGQDIYALLTPVGEFQPAPSNPHYAMWGLIGMGVQLAVIVFLQTTIVARLRRTVAEAV